MSNLIVTQKASKANQAIKNMLDLYGIPLARAMRILRDEYKWTNEKVAQRVWNGEVSKQAVQQAIEKLNREEVYK